jgi:hypothetical protein
MLVSLEDKTAKGEHFLDVAASHAKPVREHLAHVDPLASPPRIGQLGVGALQIQEVLHVPWPFKLSIDSQTL